jgi:hypothetical protein
MAVDRFNVEYGGKPLNPVQAAERLPFGPKKIRQMCVDGEIESITYTDDAGRPRYGIYPAAIDAWIRTHTTAAA